MKYILILLLVSGCDMDWKCFDSEGNRVFKGPKSEIVYLGRSKYKNLRWYEFEGRKVLGSCVGINDGP